MISKAMIRLAAIEVLIVAWALSCSSERPIDMNFYGSEGDSYLASGGSGGSPSSGGSTSYKAPTFAESGGAAFGHPCDRVPTGFLNPPCSSADFIVPEGCNQSGTLSFKYPVGEHAISMQEIQLLLLAIEDDTGYGGQGGETAGLLPLILSVSFNPPELGAVRKDIDGNFFLVSDAQASVSSAIRLYDLEYRPYINFGGSDRSDGVSTPYFSVTVALANAEGILSERRVIFESTLQCHVP